jgi:hypothetical protein
MKFVKILGILFFSSIILGIFSGKNDIEPFQTYDPALMALSIFNAAESRGVKFGQGSIEEIVIDDIRYGPELRNAGVKSMIDGYVTYTMRSSAVPVIRATTHIIRCRRVTIEVEANTVERARQATVERFEQIRKGMESYALSNGMMKKV